MQICITAFTRAMASKHCRMCLRTVAEVRCTALFSRASPDNLAERLSALLESRHATYLLSFTAAARTGAREEARDLSCDG